MIGQTGYGEDVGGCGRVWEGGLGGGHPQDFFLTEPLLHAI